jgi:serine/threonine protein kinase
MNSLKISDKKEKPKAKDTNSKNLCKINFNKKSSLSLNLLDDSSKKGINIKSFEKVELLFHYSYGKVYKVKLKKNHIKEFNIKSEFLILKRIKKKEINRLKQLKFVEDEINLISQCDCPYILKILFSFQDKKYIYMVKEYCPGGNLKWHINSNLFEEEEARFYIAELILVIEHLHKKGIVYKNLKTEKIFINDKNHIQLIGYGLIKEKKKNKDNKNDEGNGSNEDENFFFGIQDEYISPEILALRGEEKMADIYGIGEVLYEMVSGTKPFYSKENADLFKQDIYKNKNKLMLNDYFSMELKNLLMKLLCRDPENRIGVNDISEIKKHLFFKDIDWTKLGKMEIVPPIDLVKNKLDNKNNMYFRKKSNKQKDFFLDFNIIKNMEKSSLIKQNETNNDEKAKNENEENKLNNSGEKEDDENNKYMNKNENIIININENYIEGSTKKDEKDNSDKI